MFALCATRGHDYLYSDWREYWPRFLPFSLVIAFSTSLFARAIAFEDREEDNDPLGSGRPSFGLKKLLIDILPSDLVLLSDRKFSLL